MLGLGAAFLRDTLDDALTSKDAAERLGNAPVLAMVPMVNSWKKRKRTTVAASSDPTSPAAEAYRSLRTSVQFIKASENLRALLVTSPASAEGKTSPRSPTSGPCSPRRASGSCSSPATCAARGSADSSVLTRSRG